MDNVKKINNAIARKLEIQNSISEGDLEIQNSISEGDLEIPSSALVTTETLKPEIDVSNMLSDFAYVRQVLIKNTECARSTLEYVSANMLDDDNSVTPGMLNAFSELNKSITENMRLFVTSYKELSSTLANINNVQSSKQNVTNNLNIINTEDSSQVVNVRELIDKLKGSK